MAARRLIIVLLVLLGVSIFATALAPTESDDGDTGTATAPTTTTASDPATAGPVDPGPPLALRLNAYGKPETVPLEVGRAVSLDVHAKVAATVEIPAFGLISYVDPVAPAHFELLPDEPGTFEVRLLEQNRIAGRLRVSAPEKP